MFEFTQTIPLSLYIHLPWCLRKCPYCDFNSHALRQDLPEAAYIQALIQDLEADLPLVWGRRLVSIFFGGGTPSLFSPAAIEQILASVRARIPFSPDIEITLEANPGSVEQGRFEGFGQAGVNRLSLGIQSFQDQKLTALGRIHSADVAKKAVIAARSAGFSNFNIDLMHGLPGQTVADALSDLQTAESLTPTHLSWYQLTLEPNTLFHQKPPVLPDEAELAAIQDQGMAWLAAHGYEHYEVSAYSQPGRQCQHNLNYWEFGDYLGIGAGAHGKLTDIHNKTVTRYWKTKHPKDYLDLAKPALAGKQEISAADMPFEFMLNALRLQQAIPTALFITRSGLPLNSIEDKLNIAQAKGLLHWDQMAIQPTPLGRRFLNDLTEIFM